MSARNILFVSSLLLLLAAHPTLLSASPEKNTSDAGTQLGERARIRALLKQLNKPYLKTIESPDGDTIDCIPFHLQPAFDHPKLRGQKPLEPPELPMHYESHGTKDKITQLWRTTGETCPEGTVPIRRTKEEEVMQVERFGRKPGGKALPAVDLSNHEHSYARVKGGSYFGADAFFNLWKPQVASPDEFSLSQLWITSGTFGYDLNTIEVGWQVYPYLYGDASPRLFVYWTRDSYENTGCYNLLCPGFVQVSNQIALGATLTPTSTYNGDQYAYRFTVWMDQATENWWLQAGTTTVGYWPKSLFTNMGGGATEVEYGGEIINTGASGQHTTTQMGSGHFAAEGFGKAAYISNLAFVNNQNTLYPVNDPTIHAEAATCYDIQEGSKGSNWGTYFFFGGPGGNSNCP